MDKMDGVLKYSQQYLDKMDGVSLFTNSCNEGEKKRIQVLSKFSPVSHYTKKRLEMEKSALKCGSKSFLRNRKFLRNGMLFLDLYILEILLLFCCKILKILMLFEYEIHNHP